MRWGVNGVWGDSTKAGASAGKGRRAIYWRQASAGQYGPPVAGTGIATRDLGSILVFEKLILSHIRVSSSVMSCLRRAWHAPGPVVGSRFDYRTNEEKPIRMAERIVCASPGIAASTSHIALIVSTERVGAGAGI